MALGSKAPTDKIEDLAKREAKRQAHKSWSEPASYWVSSDASLQAGFLEEQHLVTGVVYSTSYESRN
jgi:hypothetical protein